MQLAYPNVVNRMVLPLVDQSVQAITSGVVNFYLKDRDGENAGKWYRGSDNTWQSAVSIAAVGVYEGDNGLWHGDISAEAWTENVTYTLYAKDNSDRHLPYDDQVLCTSATASLVAIATKVATFVSGPMTVISPVDSNQNITITRYLDYLVANSNPFVWTNTGGSWCGGDLSGATITFTARDSTGTVVLTIPALIVVATGSQQIALEMTSAQSGLFLRFDEQYQYGMLIRKSGYRDHEVFGNIAVVETLNAPEAV